jgi:UDP-GlcNAc:undecaprenyl-phosphate GlcNAc-1-phosphate transferase
MSETVMAMVECMGPESMTAGATAVVAFACAAILAVPVRALAFRVGAVDHPGGRKTHARPTARLGGLAILAALLVAMALGVSAPVDGHDQRGVGAVLLSCALVCGVGILDDLRPLRPVAKLLGLIGAAAVLVAGGVRIEHLDLPLLPRLDLGYWGSVAVTVVWVVVCANAMNLIDGVDGASCGVAIASSGALGLMTLGLGHHGATLLFAAVCGSTLGFYLHNRQPARIFLGDSGSLLLGFAIAATSALGCTKRATALTLVAALLALAVPLLDSTQSFVRRFRQAFSRDSQRRILRALRATAVGDRGHIHHRLLRRGLSHQQVARVLFLATALTGFLSLLLLEPGGVHPAIWVTGLLTAVWCLARLLLVEGEQEPPRQQAQARPEPEVEPDYVLPARPAQAARRTPDGSGAAREPETEEATL